MIKTTVVGIGTSSEESSQYCLKDQSLVLKMIDIVLISTVNDVDQILMDVVLRTTPVLENAAYLI